MSLWEAVYNRLDGSGLAQFVGGTMDVPAAVAQGVNASPTWLVVRAGSQADGPRHRSTQLPMSQFEFVQVAVLIGLQSYNDPTGWRQNQALDDTVNDVRSLLRDWRPLDGWDRFELHRGDLVSLKNGVWHLEAFKTRQLVGG